MTIGVLDYGAGNIKNVCRAIEHLGYKYRLVSKNEELKDLDKLIIPGVGAFKVAMSQLQNLQLIEPIKKFALEGKPILGICLGMQLLFDMSSEFGETKGLGLIEGTIEKVPSIDIDDDMLKVPHIGWNELLVNDNEKNIISGVKSNDAVYFVHSFRAQKFVKEQLVASCLYGGHIIPAIVQHKNVVGCQFHPEKSGSIGLEIFNNFLKEN